MFWGNIDVHSQAKYRKDRIKIEEVNLIFIKVDGRTMDSRI